MPPQLHIRFATTSDGLRVAYNVIGDDGGPAMVVLPVWVSHLELEWQSPSGEFMRRLARGRRVIVYDGRGTGLSDRNVTDLTREARLKDLEAVVDHAGLERFILFGPSQNSPVAIEYAAKHPERITELILYASFCRIADPQEQALVQAVIGMIRAEWGAGAQTTMGFIHPDADREEMETSLAVSRAASSGEVAASILQENYFNTDVREYLPRITAPALVLHRRDDKAVRLEHGREVATLLPNARFVVLEGDHHPLYAGEVEVGLRAIDEFLGVEPAPAPVLPPPAAARLAHDHGHDQDHDHIGAPVTILFTDMEGSTSLTQRLGDAQAQEVVRAHNGVVRDALGAHGGAEIKHTGDGIMASFPSASGALEAAIAVQRGLALHNQEHPELPIYVRIGLNAGEPVREQDDLFGQAVQVARRVCDMAAPGQILASNVVRELVAGKGFLFADQGETGLRGFEDPLRLYEVHWTE